MRRAGLGLLVLGALACALAARSGFFLADDFTQLALFGEWDREGRFAAEVARRFVGSMDEADAFYRPLTLVTFAANYLANGTRAPAWVAVNLMLHLASACLVAALVLRLAGPRSRAAVLAAILSGVVFFSFSPSWEVALWVASRYDALATFFTLAAGWAFLRARPAWAVAAGAGALLAKESGALAIVFVAFLALADAFTAGDGRGAGERVRAATRLLLPWIALGALYAALRVALFGSATRVYGTGPAAFPPVVHWRSLYESFTVWAKPNFPGPGAFVAMLAASIVVLAVGIVLSSRRDRRTRAYLLALCAASFAAIALLLPHLSRFESSGVGGRLFYQAAAFYAIALGLCVHEAVLAAPLRPIVGRGTLALAVVLVAVHAAWGVNAARMYREAQRGMRTLVGALPRVASEGGPGDFVVVVVPDTVGRVLFGANAPAGMVLPPVQRVSLSHQVLVWSDHAIDALDRAIDGGLLAALREVPLLALGREPARAWPRLAPARMYCWNAQQQRLARLPVDVSKPGTVAVQAARAYVDLCGGG